MRLISTASGLLGAVGRLVLEEVSEQFPRHHQHKHHQGTVALLYLTTSVQVRVTGQLHVSLALSSGFDLGPPSGPRVGSPPQRVLWQVLCIPCVD